MEEEKLLRAIFGIEKPKEPMDGLFTELFLDVAHEIQKMTFIDGFCSSLADKIKK